MTWGQKRQRHTTLPTKGAVNKKNAKRPYLLNLGHYLHLGGRAPQFLGGNAVSLRDLPDQTQNSNSA